ncbi:MAG: hypothetical protein GY810_08840 [Aureispira sp.]|nr:hypothetical protein [Aureispira sp.]
MKKNLLLFALLIFGNALFAQNNEGTQKLTVKEGIEVIPMALQNVKYVETPDGYKLHTPQKKELDLASGIALHPDDIVSDEVIAKQIKAVEDKILLNKDDQKAIFQLNKELVNLKARRKYMTDNNLN